MRFARSRKRLAHYLWGKLSEAAHRPPDFVVGGRGNPYMYRWWLIPRNKVCNIYLHQFFRSDDDRALHDHPWCNMSFLLSGKYAEHTIAAGGVHKCEVLEAGALKFRGASFAHRVELVDGGCWTLFVTGPTIRTWGFHCPNGWRPWKQYSKPGSKGEIGLGCD